LQWPQGINPLTWVVAVNGLLQLWQR